MCRIEEKAFESVSNKQQGAEATLPGRQLGLYSKMDKRSKIDRKEVRNMVNKLNPDKNSMGSRG